MRITFLLFLTLSSLLISCSGDKTDIKKFDIDSRDFMFFNEGSYWIYERDDDKLDTITLVEVSESVGLNYDGTKEVENRIDTYWSSYNKEFFKRTSKDTIIRVYDKVLKKKVDREIFRYSSKFRTYYSNYFKVDGFVDQTCYVSDNNDSTYLGKEYRTKTIISQFPNESTTTVKERMDSAKFSTTYAHGLGIARYRGTIMDSSYTLKLVDAHLE